MMGILPLEVKIIYAIVPLIYVLSYNSCRKLQKLNKSLEPRLLVSFRGYLWGFNLVL